MVLITVSSESYPKNDIWLKILVTSKDRTVVDSDVQGLVKSRKKHNAVWVKVGHSGMFAKAF